VSFRGVKWPGCEDHSPPPGVVVENGWRCISNPHMYSYSVEETNALFVSNFEVGGDMSEQHERAGARMIHSNFRYGKYNHVLECPA
jgi:hypothetical protein